MYSVFWLTFLGTLIFLLAWVISWSTRLKTLVGRRMWPFLVFLLTLLVLLPPVGLGYYLWDENIQPTWLFGYALSLALIYIILGVVLMFRGLRNAAVNPRGRNWPRRGLLVLTCLCIVVAAGAFFYLNHKVMVRLGQIYEQSTAQAKEILPKSVTDEQNAFPIYEKAKVAFEKAGKPPEWFTKDYQKADPTSPEVTAFITDQAMALDLTRKAAALSGYDQKLDVTNMIAGEIPQFAPLRSLNRLLSLSARNKAANGDTKGAADDWIAMGRLTNHIGSYPMLINVMIAVTFNNERLKVLEDLLKFSPDFARQAPKDCLPDDEALIRQFIQSMKLEGLALNQAIAKAGQSSQLTIDMDLPSGALAPATSALWRVFLLPPDLDAMVSIHDDLINALSKPSTEIQKAVDDIDTKDQITKGGILTAIAVPSYKNYYRRVGQAQATNRLMRLALATASYYQDKSQYPASQDDLTPEYLPEKLLDPFTGKDLVMKTVPEGLDLESQGMPPAYEGDKSGGPVVFHLRLPKTEKQE
jgi:hypothetical protein